MVAKVAYGFAGLDLIIESMETTLHEKVDQLDAVVRVGFFEIIYFSTKSQTFDRALSDGEIDDSSRSTGESEHDDDTLPDAIKYMLV